jgi:uncharacterized protein (TIGR02611 family)
VTPTDAPPQRNALAAFRARVRRLPGGWLAWRIMISIVGGAIIVVGIILLPLPGPGWLIIFLGLGLWGTEFEWASRLLHWVRAQVKRWTDWVLTKPRWLQMAIGLALFLFTAAVVVGCWYLLRQF